MLIFNQEKLRGVLAKLRSLENLIKYTKSLPQVTKGNAMWNI